MVELKNFEALSRQLDDWIAGVFELTEQVARGYSVVVFKMLLENSPQFSGDYTANWKYSVGHPDTDFIPGTVKPRGSPDWANPFIAGDRPAIVSAINQNRGREDGFRLGDTVFISNSATHDEPYAVLIETNQIQFRPGNLGRVMSRTEAIVGANPGYQNMPYESARKLARQGIA